ADGIGKLSVTTHSHRKTTSRHTQLTPPVSKSVQSSEVTKIQSKSTYCRPDSSQLMLSRASFHRSIELSWANLSISFSSSSLNCGRCIASRESSSCCTLRAPISAEV